MALNGKSYTLDPTITVIANDEGADGIGGIMGGEPSSVTETTTDILIECAWFDPKRIALSGQKLALTSDARSRFERGADPAFVEAGLQLGTALAIELAGGDAFADRPAGPPPVPNKVVHYRPARCAALAGVAVPEDRQQDILQRLGFTVTRDEIWQVAVPSWRPRRGRARRSGRGGDPYPRAGRGRPRRHCRARPGWRRRPRRRRN